MSILVKNVYQIYCFLGTMMYWLCWFNCYTLLWFIDSRRAS